MADKPNLIDVLKELLNDHMGKSEFLAAVKEMKKYLDDTHSANKTELHDAAKLLAEGFARLREELTTSTSDTTTKSSASLDAKFAAIEARILDRISTLKDGEPGQSPDPAEIVSLVLAQLNLPEQRAVVLDGPDEIRNKLELLQGDERLDKSAIKGLDELDAKVKEVAARPNGGGGGLSRIALQFALSKLIKHEKFTTSSATTTVSLANKVAGSVCLWLRYNGAMLRYGTDYTLSGKVVTFVGFTLDDSSSVEVTYFAD